LTRSRRSAKAGTDLVSEALRWLSPALRARVLVRRRDELRAHALAADQGSARVRRRLRGCRLYRAPPL